VKIRSTAVAALAAAIVIAIALAAVFSLRGSRSPAEGPIILISIDTLRADRLPAYGYTKIRTPAIDALAADGVLFERAYAHVPQTLPAHASILTGLLPFEHGVRDNVGFAVKPNESMLQHALKAKGYATGGFVSAYVLRRETGIGAGFDVYDSDFRSSSPELSIGQVQRDGADTLERAQAWLSRLGSSKFFLFLHLYEPHVPYRPPARFASYAPYDGEIAYSDELVGRFIQTLKDRNLYESSTIVLLSDHGEGLGDHGELEHGLFIYDESIRIPFVVKPARTGGFFGRFASGGSGGRRVTNPVQQIDVAPTLGEAAGLTSPSSSRHGRSLWAVVLGADPATIDEAGIYSESFYARYHFGWSELQSLTDARYRFVKAPQQELYDLTNDPREKRNIVRDRPQAANAMRAAIERLSAGAGVDRPSVITAAEREQFQALGYVGMQADLGPDVKSESLPDPKDKVGTLERYRRAVTLASARDFDGAIAGLQDILRDNPDMADVWQQLGNLLTRTDRTEEALAAYKHFVELKPTQSSGLAAVASTLLKLRRLDEARAHGELAVKVAAPHERVARAAAHELLAKIALARKDGQAALREAKLAQQEDPTLPMPLYVQGLLLHTEGRYSEALPFFTDAARQLKSRTLTISELYFYLGDTLARLGRNAEAEVAFKEERRLFPQHPRSYASLAMLYRSLGRDAEAEAAIQDMLTAAPVAESYSLATQLYTMFGEPQKAAAIRRQRSP
jgi:arylsulfatase A-like enzyme/Flp pilus assembly protein TadD